MPAKVPAEFIDQVGSKNAIINGDMRIAQRGVSFPAIVFGAYSLDRWKYFKSGAMIHTVTQSTDVPTGSTGFSYKADCTTPDAAIGAADFSIIRQSVEGYNVRRLQGKLVTLSFQVKATVTGIYSVSFRNSGVDRYYIAEYEVGVADTWEQKSVTLTLDTSTGTWDFTNGTGLIVDFNIAGGSDFYGTVGSWQTGSKSISANQVNGCGSTSDLFVLTDVQLELGSSASGFEHRPFDEELIRCERYYQKTYNYADFPGSATFAGVIIGRKVLTDPFNYMLNRDFGVRMRTTPTITMYAPATGTINAVTNSSGGSVDIAINSISRQGEHTMGLIRTTTNPIATQAIEAHMTADAEL